MKISVLTSSRADYSIYLPLLKALRADPFFDLRIIAFGTHLSEAFGYTVRLIEQDGFTISQAVETMPRGDAAADIATAMGETISRFAAVWQHDSSDLVIALGDRFEMFAACMAAVPFGKKIAHIHGGETTLGAIDDTFRNAITQAATLHFVTTHQYAKRVAELKGADTGIHNVGALSNDNLASLPLLDKAAFQQKFGIDLTLPSILITFHPETVGYEKNEDYIVEILSALAEVKDYQFIFTMPNADTQGNIIREHIHAFVAHTPHAVAVESFGTLGYLSCMKHCAFLLGNTSSGFVEAAFFPKYVINLGNRQTGRIITPNIRNTAIAKADILAAIEAYTGFEMPGNAHIYGTGDAAAKILTVLKSLPK